MLAAFRRSKKSVELIGSTLRDLSILDGFWVILAAISTKWLSYGFLRFLVEDLQLKQRHSSSNPLYGAGWFTSPVPAQPLMDEAGLQMTRTILSRQGSYKSGVSWRDIR